MQGILVFAISIIFIGICFAAVMRSSKRSNGGFKRVATIPEELQTAFREFADDLLAPEGILLEEGKITKIEPVAEVPYIGMGVFEYYKIEFILTPESPVENAHGIVLNSREMFAKAGFRDDVLVLFFKEEENIFEISFMPEKRIAMQGYKAHIETRYRNLKDWRKLDEYAFTLGEKRLTLGENLLGQKPLEEAAVRRERAEGHFAYSATYIDIFETEHLEISSWVQFERKKELIFSMRTSSHKVKTGRGIGVGDTVEQLKEKYPIELAYVENFQEQGNAYGYIPEDGSTCYIAFRTQESVITEIIMTDAFGERPFIPKDGYVDQDIPWTEVDYSAKLTEKYARGLYLGQHKADMEARQVFNTFVTNTFDSTGIIDKGLWREYELEGEELYFVIYKNPKEEARVYVEIMLRRISLKTFTNESEIWVVTKFRSQKKRG